MSTIRYPEKIENWIGGERVSARGGEYYSKCSPHHGQEIFKVARSREDDAQAAVAAARVAFNQWSGLSSLKRGEILFSVAALLKERAQEVTAWVAHETGKSPKDAAGEVGAAVAQAYFMAGEGARLYGKSLRSGMEGRQVFTVREPVGVAALVVASNTPIANIAWKVFPALICGNTAVLKASEDTPGTAEVFAEIAHKAGLPSGVLNVLQGLGLEAGVALTTSCDVDLISFTGSTQVGRRIQQGVAHKPTKVFLELGGKNPLVVCDDADLDNAVKWSVASSFSNAGQRCASSSRIIVMEKVYSSFKEKFLEAAERLRLGPKDSDDLGAVINRRQLDNMLASIQSARDAGASILCGGKKASVDDGRDGYYLEPTIIEGAPLDHEVSQRELFGPITCLYRVASYEEAVELANRTVYGLTACIHTANVHRVMDFSKRIRAGVVISNAGTHGSEPHLPFGGVKDSGNGLREPGTEALDVYTNWKNLYINTDSGCV